MKGPAFLDILMEVLDANVQNEFKKKRTVPLSERRWSSLYNLW